MPRCARQKIENGIYHICIRGNNRQDIFLDDKDRDEYLTRLRHYKERYKVHIYAYCLMTNHIHLLIYDNAQDISKFMQGLSLSYVIYFNNRHGRTGHLFQDRFTSVLVTSDVQILCTSKYIHLNPIKANMVKQIDEYKWSSYRTYVQGEDQLNIVDTQFLCKINAVNEVEGRKAYLQYINEVDRGVQEDEIASTEESNDSSHDYLQGIKRLRYEEIYKILYRAWKEKRHKESSEKYYFERNEVVIYLLALISRLSYKQIAKRLNFNVSIVYKKVKDAVNKMIKDHMFYRHINKIIVNL